MLHLTKSLPPVWRSAVHGALLGDALGVPHEFKQSNNIPCAKDIEMIMPLEYHKTYEKVPYGTWSDDGSQLLALLDTLIVQHGQFNKSLFVQNLLAWYTTGKYQAGGLVFDCGTQTRAALHAYLRSKEADLGISNRCGNGSLMRVLPVAALPENFGITPAQALRIAMAQSDVTHPNPIARVSCALYIEILWAAKDGVLDRNGMIDQAAGRLRQRAVLTPEELAAVAVAQAYPKNNMPVNSGYVLNSLWSACWAVSRATSLSSTLQFVVSGAGDTDTVACIAGGLAAVLYGFDDTSAAWLSQMVSIPN